MLILVMVTLVAALALISLGGGLYEYLVVDPAWPRRPENIQPQRGGISRKRFWIPAHSAFELVLILTLIAGWTVAAVRTPLLVALGAHAVMRGWSAFDFIPKALAFERADPATIDERSARRWTRRSMGRLPIDLIVCAAALCAVVACARVTP